MIILLVGVLDQVLTCTMEFSSRRVSRWHSRIGLFLANQSAGFEQALENPFKKDPYAIIADSEFKTANMLMGFTSFEGQESK